MNTLNEIEALIKLREHAIEKVRYQRQLHDINHGDYNAYELEKWFVKLQKLNKVYEDFMEITIDNYIRNE